MESILNSGILYSFNFEPYLQWIVGGVLSLLAIELTRMIRKRNAA